DSEEESSAISVNIYLKAILKLKNLRRPYSFAELRIKNRNSLGNIVTKHQVERVSRIMNIAKTDDDTISIEATIKTTPTPVQSPPSDEDTLQQGSLEI
ncbi:MAG: DNA topoisomerase, partial [Akkermansia sp.]